jgi:hypothetical protein
MVRGPPAGVNLIFTCHRGSYGIPGASSGTRGVTDGLSRLFLSVATDGASWDKAFFYQVLTFFTDGVRPRNSPCAFTVKVVESCAVRYVPFSDRIPVLKKLGWQTELEEHFSQIGRGCSLPIL